MDRTFLLIGSVLGFLGVAFGAFGAHALKARLAPEALAVFETGVRYQMYHVFALLIVAAAIGRLGSARLLTISGWSFIGGILLFSGSLYALTLTGVGAFGPITPIGGVLFLLGWACLAIFAAAR
jgi:uncharacterized membrane protein YgdD (TMEM256/DUF423 family)